MMKEATREQKEVLKNLLEWLKQPDAGYITFGGYAGTGKTTTVALFRQVLAKIQPKVKVAFCAYTGKASRVLATALKLNQVNLPQDSVSTIHALIYAPMTDSHGQVTGWKRKNSISADLIIVDEASMVDELIFQDLLSFRLPIIAVGDHGQLPPVNGTFNLMGNPKLKLETIQRQAQDNPIIKVSIMAREDGKIPIKEFGRGVKKLNRYDSATGQEVEEILRQNRAERLVLTGFNHTRIKLNLTVRNYLEFEGEAPRVGETLICLRNNWEAGIYNGMTGRLNRVIPLFHEGNLHWYEAEINVDDDFEYCGKISAHQFNQSTTLREFGNFKGKALGDLWDFGYALTVHKAQGSEAESVLLFEERNKHMTDEDWRRWLYTGVTRAKEKLTIVGS